MEKVYVGVTGGGWEHGMCRDSITQLDFPAGAVLRHARGTKGYESRQRHINNFMDSDFDWLVMLDADMVFPSDTIQRLLSHEKQFVSGYYLFRQVQPMMRPIWFYPPEGGMWPLRPYFEDPERGRLHELGASGWGVILLHRDVITDTRAILRHEAEVLEDDMDVWPYDLRRIMTAINGLDRLVRDWERADDPWEDVAEYAKVLKEEIRPLRGVFQADDQGRISTVGSDIRFAWYARQAGHILWGDPDLRCDHVLAYPLHPDEYSHSFAALPDDKRASLTADVDKQMADLHAQFQAQMAELGR